MATKRPKPPKPHRTWLTYLVYGFPDKTEIEPFANAHLELEELEARLARAVAVCEALDEWNRVGVPPFTSAEWHGITEAYKAWLVGKEDC